jgi:hypothetical protein
VDVGTFGGSGKSDLWHMLDVVPPETDSQLKNTKTAPEVDRISARIS